MFTSRGTFSLLFWLVGVSLSGLPVSGLSFEELCRDARIVPLGEPVSVETGGGRLSVIEIAVGRSGLLSLETSTASPGVVSQVTWLGSACSGGDLFSPPIEIEQSAGSLGLFVPEAGRYLFLLQAYGGDGSATFLNAWADFVPAVLAPRAPQAVSVDRGSFALRAVDVLLDRSSTKSEEDKVDPDPDRRPCLPRASQPCAKSEEDKVDPDPDRGPRSRRLLTLVSVVTSLSPETKSEEDKVDPDPDRRPCSARASQPCIKSEEDKVDPDPDAPSAGQAVVRADLVVLPGADGEAFGTDDLRAVLDAVQAAGGR